MSRADRKPPDNDPRRFPPGTYPEDRNVFRTRVGPAYALIAVLLILGLVGISAWYERNGGSTLILARGLVGEGGVITTVLALGGWYMREKRAPQIGGLQRETGELVKRLDAMAADSKTLGADVREVLTAKQAKERAEKLAEGKSSYRAETSGFPAVHLDDEPDAETGLSFTDRLARYDAQNREAP